jgi:hypothetical protein
MGYTILNSNAVFPAQVSYQLITLTADLVVTWPFSFASGTIIASINDVNTNAGEYKITLPDATLASVGQTILFNNIGSNSFLVNNNGGTTLQTITSGQILYFYLYDNTTSPASNGLWRIIPFGEGGTSITTFTVESTGNTIDVTTTVGSVNTDGVITPPGGTIELELAPSIANLNSVNTTGFPVITGTAPLTWVVRDIIGGTNILITDGDGLSDNPTIDLTATITDLTSISVGTINITGSEIYSNNTNDGLTIDSNGSGPLTLNGVIIDTSGNITEVNNLTIDGALTIDGTFINSYTPKAWCMFTDTLVGVGDHNIIVRNQVNINPTITGGGGLYTLTFTTPLTNNYYGVLVTVGTETIGGLPIVNHGFSIFNAQTINTCQIAVVDASGQYVQQALNGITVQILSAT